MWELSALSVASHERLKASIWIFIAFSVLEAANKLRKFFFPSKKNVYTYSVRKDKRWKSHTRSRILHSTHQLHHQFSALVWIMNFTWKMYDDFTYANNNILFISRKNLYILRYVALALKIHAQISLLRKSFTRSFG